MTPFELLLDKLNSHLLQPLLNWKKRPICWKRLKGFKNYTTQTGSITLFYKNGKMEISALTPDIWRVTADMNGRDYRSRVVIREETIPIEAAGEGDNLILTASGGTKVSVNKTKGTLAFFKENTLLHQDKKSPGFAGEWVKTSKKASKKEYYMGFGEKTGKLFKNRSKLVMWNTDNASLNPNSDPMYQSCPLRIALREDGTAHGLYYDNPHYSVFKQGGTGPAPANSYAAAGGPLCYYVLAGPTIRDVTRQFSLLTGKYSLPPLWVLGHHHSRWEVNESAARLSKLSTEFRERKIPCDVLHIDIDHLNGYRCFTWNKKVFPDPSGIIKELHDKNFKAVVISDPGMKYDPGWDIYKEGEEKNYYCKKPDGSTFYGPVWPGKSAFVDYTMPEACRWWGDLYKTYTDIEIDGFWNDMNEPSVFTARKTMPDNIIHKGGDGFPQEKHSSVHNLYGFLMIKASAEGIIRHRPEKRHFLFTRSSFAGIQRYASSWTGDNTSNWDHLRLSIPMVLNMGLSGQVMTGPDIGGFWKAPTEELMIRWIQLGIFYPFCRNHSASGTPEQEYWAIGEEVTRIARKYLELRYRLLPYIYTELQKSCRNGEPLMKPLFYHYPGDKNCLNPETANSQFLFGENLLIAPILEPGKNSRTVYLPGSGYWTAYNDNKTYRGGKEYTIQAPLDEIPIFIKEGSVLPMTEPVQSTPELKGNPLFMEIYPADRFSGTLYLDDGESLQYREGAFTRYTISGEITEKELSITLQHEGPEDLWGYSELILRLHTKTHPESVKINGKDWSKQTTFDEELITIAYK